MVFKYIVLVLLVALFCYSLVRPFSSLFAKLFMLIGCLLGVISIIDLTYVNRFAESLGLQGGGKDLYIYVILVIAFLFICYAWEKFKKIEKKISMIVKAIAAQEHRR